MEKKGYKVSDIYQGGYSSLQPKEGPYVKAGTIGLTTDPRTMNLIQDVSTKLSSGVKYIDVTAVSPEYFDNISKQQMKEVQRLTKLTGIDVDVHGPVINPAGITQQGFSEVQRESAEKTIFHTLSRSHELNPDGNIHVNFHSSEGVPGSQPLPPKGRKKGEEYKKIIAIDQDTGRQMIPLEPDTFHFPEAEDIEKGEYKSPEQRIKMLNKTQWDNQISQLLINEERMNEVLERTKPFLEQFKNPQTGKIEIANPNLLPHESQKRVYRDFEIASNYLQDLHLQANNIFSKAWEFGTDHQKEILKSYSEEFKKKLEGNKDMFSQSEAMHELLNNLRSRQITPELFVPVEKFTMKKGAESFGNAAFESYKKFKEKSPVLVIENPPAGHALSTGKEIREIVEKSREQFVKKAVEKGMSEGVAKKQAEKFIGATWDVGHINMLRKYGYSEEDIIKESEEVKKVLKHIHLSDNFGMEHTELPMGMGNVPMKEIMEKLGKKGYEAKKLIEAGQWWQQFKTPPFQETLEGLNSPIYSMKMTPYWSQAAGLYQGYLGGLDGQWLPQTHYETFGGGFSRLPAELGGQQQGAQGSRMSGRPMQ